MAKKEVNTGSGDTSAEMRKAFALRISARLMAELEAWAQDEFRSVNGQIEYLLHTAVQQRRKGKNKQNSTSLTDGQD